MINLKIPGHEPITVAHVTFDYNGTLAVDGFLVTGLKERLVALAKLVEVHILTADTFGLVRAQCQDLPVTIEIFSKDNISKKKKAYVEKIGGETNIAIGNGNNDREMFEESRLSIVVMGKEGCCVKSLLAADIVVNNPLDALDLLLNTDRMVATLRT
ncbi:HAD family hydrolase [Acetobacterium sp.]|uniref:HAD family hydrolase n=1 Tax=Acetobacterium sp. TaxID=1872094 RepID=UPI003593915F